MVLNEQLAARLLSNWFLVGQCGVRAFSAYNVTFGGDILQFLRCNH